MLRSQSTQTTALVKKYTHIYIYLISSLSFALLNSWLLVAVFPLPLPLFPLEHLRAHKRVRLLYYEHLLYNRTYLSLRGETLLSRGSLSPSAGFIDLSPCCRPRRFRLNGERIKIRRRPRSTWNNNTCSIRGRSTFGIDEAFTTEQKRG